MRLEMDLKSENVAVDRTTAIAIHMMSSLNQAKWRAKSVSLESANQSQLLDMGHHTANTTHDGWIRDCGSATVGGLEGSLLLCLISHNLSDTGRLRKKHNGIRLVVWRVGLVGSRAIAEFC